MPLELAARYRHLAKLIESWPPSVSDEGRPSTQTLQWLARAQAIINECDSADDIKAFSDALRAIHNASPSAQREARDMLQLIIFRAFATAELGAPVGERGAFIPAGNTFDAQVAITKVLRCAAHDVLVVDPYLDDRILIEFGSGVADNCTLRLMAGSSSHDPSLIVTAKKWSSQSGSCRPLEVRLAPQRILHDRAIFIDRTSAWTLTQSLKDFAKRSPAEIVRIDDTAAMKIAAYEDIWAQAQIVV